MKNYPHLYTPVNKKASFSNQLKTHKKTTSIIGNQNQYNKIPSSKTINHINNSISRRANNYPRINSRSIQQMHLDRSSEDNYDMMQRKNMLLQQHRQMANQFYHSPTFGQFGGSTAPINYQADRYSIQSNQDSELFQRSYKKIGEIKYHVHNKNIDNELNEVLQLIKQQKLRANQTVKTLKKAADHYKRICQTVNKSFVDSGVNTQEQLQYFKQIQTKDVDVQCNESQQKITVRQSSPTFSKVQHTTPQIINQKSSPVGSGKKFSTPPKQTYPSTSSTPNQQKGLIDGKQKQIYLKLATMLQDMNINSKQILPQQIELGFELKNYKNLSEAEIIKIQKFFIKKLVEKIPK